MSTYRFFKASALHREFIASFYEARPELKDSSYARQYEALMNECVAWADFWKINLEKTGKFFCQEILVNVEPLQKAWAKEHAVPYSEHTWIADILLAQALEFKPDVFFSHDFTHIKSDLRAAVKKAFPRVKIIGWDGVAKNDPARFQGCDIMLSCLESVTDFYKAQGFLAYFFPFGFEAGVLERIDRRQPAIDCVFAGSIVLGDKNHNHRLKLLSYLVRHTAIEIRMPRFPRWPSLIKQNIMGTLRGTGAFWNLLPHIWRVQKRAHGKPQCFGLDMYQIMSDAKITVNSHIDSVAGSAANMRLFEATGVGTCLLTDWKENIADYFMPDKEVAVYRTPEECLAKIRQLLSHESERTAIARRGQEKTCRDYTFEKRIAAFSEFLIKNL